MERVNMASALTDHVSRGRLVRTSLALVMLSACSQEPTEQDAGTSGARKTSEPAQEQRTAAQKECRDEVAAAFERLKTSGRPYRNETTATFDGQTSRKRVEFVAPDQMRLSDDSLWIMNAYYIWIGQQAWANWSPFPWRWSKEPPDPRYIQMKLGANDPFSRVLSNSSPIYECLGRVEFEGTAYFGYRARLTWTIVGVNGPFNGTLSEAQKRDLDRLRQKLPQQWRTVFVDPESGLPAYELVAQKDQLGNPSSKVQFVYPNNIDIEPPLWCRLGLCR